MGVGKTDSSWGKKKVKGEGGNIKMEEEEESALCKWMSEIFSVELPVSAFRAISGSPCNFVAAARLPLLSPFKYLYQNERDFRICLLRCDVLKKNTIHGFFCLILSWEIGRKLLIVINFKRKHKRFTSLFRAIFHNNFYTYLWYMCNDKNNKINIWK